jgi:hypothetical protein
MAVTLARDSSRKYSTPGEAQRRIRVVIRAIKKIVSVRAVLAFGLMFWCAGTGCMMVNYARAAATELNDAAMVMDHAMAGSMSMDAHACCKARRPSAKAHQSRIESKSESAELNLTLPSTPTPTGAMNCCPLTSGSIIVTSRSQSNDRATVLHHGDSASLLLIQTDPAPLVVPLRLPNRAHSYLLDCAFLI